MKSIRFKLIFIYFILVFIVMIISGSYIILSTKTQETQKIENQLKSTTRYVKEQVLEQYKDSSLFQNGLDSILIQQNLPLQDAQVSILDSTGKTIATTIESHKGNIIEHKNSVIIEGLSGKESFGKTSNYSQNSTVERWFSYAYPLLDDSGNLEYIIYAQVDSDTITENLMQTASTISIAVLLALFFAVLLGSLFSNTITAPIAILTKKANLLATGNLEQYISVKGEDELGQLTRSFNHMARELRKTVSEMENENNKLEILLQNMTDGVIAFDNKGGLLHANKVFYELMDFSITEQYRINLDIFLKKINYKKENLDIEKNTQLLININAKFIEISIIPYKAKISFLEGVIVVLKDITKQKKLDDLRKEFVANVSHEIRTPITTIKSYTETLIEGAIEEKDIAIDFLNTINDATDRMKLLTDDLLELSKFDGGKIVFNFKEENLYEIVSGCVKQNIIVANKKNQTIILNEPKNKNMKVKVDKDRINQVINNIISNSIKYSYENAKINIFFDEFKNSYVVTIQDNGIGIPQEDLERIFERFYRVDKARSRDMGGNGLGLSIAKEIMLEHKGEIKAFSRVSEGTVMQIVFPKINMKLK